MGAEPAAEDDRRSIGRGHQVTLHTIIALAALAIVYSLACRANLMDSRTRHGVRAAFTSQAMASLALAMASVIRQDWIDGAMAWFVVSVLWVLWVTAKHWAFGQPHIFRKD